MVHPFDSGPLPSSSDSSDNLGRGLESGVKRRTLLITQGEGFTPVPNRPDGMRLIRLSRVEVTIPPPVLGHKDGRTARGKGIGSYFPVLNPRPSSPFLLRGVS